MQSKKPSRQFERDLTARNVGKWKQYMQGRNRSTGIF